MSAEVLVRVTSHRARRRLTQITGELQSWFSWTAGSDFYFIPEVHLPAVLKVPGIRKARPRTDLHKTIKW